MSSKKESSTQTQRMKKPLDYAWIILGACFVIGVISFSIRFSFGVFFKSIELDFGLSRAATSGVQSLFQFLGCFVAPLGGLALDRFGPKKVFFTTGLVTALALILTSQANAIWQLYLSYSLLVSIGTAAVNSMILATTSRWFPAKRALAVGLVTSSISLGMMSAPVITIFITHFGWQGAYLILGLTALVLWVPGSLLIKRNPPPVKQTAGTKSNSPDISVSMFQAFKMPAFWLCFFIWFTQAIGMLMVMTHVVPFALDLGFSASRAAAIISVMGVTSLVARLAMGRLADLISRRLIGAICIGFMAGAMFVLIPAKSSDMLYLFAVLFGIGIGGSGPPVVAMLSDLFGTRHLGAIMGAIDTSYAVGSAFGPLAAGFIFDLRESYTLAFLVGAIMVTISLGLFLAIKVPKRVQPG
jgi:OFA family oxalate/formate antiporter-like MFS transporter